MLKLLGMLFAVTFAGAVSAAPVIESMGAARAASPPAIYDAASHDAMIQDFSGTTTMQTKSRVDAAGMAGVGASEKAVMKKAPISEMKMSGDGVANATMSIHRLIQRAG